jgi:hypothetical protein
MKYFLQFCGFVLSILIKNPRLVKKRGCCYEIKPGGVLLSHAVTYVVPSALQVLTTEFGMGSGVTPAA